MVAWLAALLPERYTLGMRHILSVLVENEFGVLSKVAGLFSGRGFNIESLCVAPTTDPTVSRITLATAGDDRVLEQVKKQLHKLVNVIGVSDYGDVDHVERELALVKVRAESKSRAEVLNVIDIFRGKVVDVGRHSYVVEVTGSQEKIHAFIELLEPYGVLEVVRTGVVAVLRGERTLAESGHLEAPEIATTHEGRIEREGKDADYV